MLKIVIAICLLTVSLWINYSDAFANCKKAGSCKVCRPLCRRYCPYGFVRVNGCPICKCKRFPQKIGQSCGAIYGRCANGLICRNGKCGCPPVCEIFCPNGNVRDKNGCPICKCKPFGKVGDKCGGVNGKCAKGLSCIQGRCRCGPVCAIFCPNGNISDKNGCPTCRCRPFGKLGDRCGVKYGKCAKGLVCRRGRCSCGNVCKNICPYGRIYDLNRCPTCRCRKRLRTGLYRM